MRKTVLILSLFLFGCIANLSAQLTGTKNIPGDYATLQLAITDLNTVGVGAGGVTLNLLAGNPQTAPAGGYSITATGTSANPIILSGNGNTITASAALTVGAIDDGIFKLIGSDYVTIQNFVMQENAANTVNAPAGSNNMTEFGVALFYATATNGASDNIIIGNTISLNRNYLNTFGIYSNTRHNATTPTTVNDITALSGSNSNNQVYSNAISNVNMGIAFIGSNNPSFQDQGNIIGSPAQGNTITNWGGAPALSSYVSNNGICYCILMNHQVGSAVRGNTISTTITTSPATIHVIAQDFNAGSPTGSATNSICRNLVTVSSAQTSGIFRAISVINGSSAITQRIDSNRVDGCAVTGVGSSVAFTPIFIGNSLASMVVSYNRILNNTTTATSGGFTGINATPALSANSEIKFNFIGDASSNAITFSAALASGQVNGIVFGGSAAGVDLSINNNYFHGFVFNSTAGASVTLIEQTVAVGSGSINNNSFDNLSLATTGSIFLINNNMAGTATSTATVSGNTIVGSFSKTVASASQVMLISGSGASAAGAQRTVENNNLSGVSTVNSAVTGINEQGGVANGVIRFIDGNTLSNWNIGSSATMIAVDATTTGSTLNSNTISSVTASGNFYGITYWFNCGGTQSCLNNAITGVSGTSRAHMISITGGPSFTAMEVAGNNLGGATSTSATFGAIGIEIQADGALSVHDNFIYDLNSVGSNANATCGINGIFSGAASAVYANKIYDVENINAAGGTNGIYIQTCSTLDIYNNLIGDLRAPQSAGTNAVCGINIAGGTAANVTFNTVYLAGTSSAANFGTAALFASTATALNSRNNLLVNNTTPTGTGVAAALTFSSTTLTNYNAASDHNAYYAGTPSASHLIFFDGTNSDQTLAAFQARVASRDANSVTENTSFTSLVGSNPAFLHIPFATASLCESGGIAVAGISNDWDGDVRPGPAGSVNGGALAPDIGADEFDGILTTCSGTPTGGTANAAVPTQCEGSTFDLSLSGSSTGTAFTYQWQSSAVSGGPYSNVSGATTASYTTAALTSTTYFVCVITCTVSGLSATSSEVMCTVNPNPVVTISPAAPAICAGGPAVNLVVSGANTYSWSPATGLSSATTNNPDANPASTTTYTVTGTSVDGCIGTETVTVTVNPLPAVGATSTPTAICVGSSATLTASGADTYIWAPLFVSGTSISVSPAATTTYTVTGTDANGCTNNATVTLNVNPVPTVGATADFTTVCAGSPVTLTGSGASSYQWDPGSVSGSPVVVNPFTNTTYTVTGTDVNGCSATATVDITVNPLPSISASATPSIICAGSTVSLDATGATTYNWMPGSLSGASVTDTPFSTTTYTVTGTDGNGCTNSTTTTVNVTPLPTVGITASPTAICTGGTVMLTGTGATSYSWMPGSFSGNPYTDSPATTTTYTVTGDDGTGCTNTATISVVVNSLPVVSASAAPGAICAGDAVSLSASGASTYNWMPGSLSGSPVSDSPSATTTYTVTGTDVNGCTATANTTVTVNPAPAIGATASSTNICEGSSAMLMASGGNSYTWMPGSLSGANVIVSPAATTTYTVTGTDVSGCSSTATITITVNPRPTVTISGSSFYCQFGSTTLTSSAGATYQWYLNGAQIPGATSQTYNASAAGIYNCLVATPLGCADSAGTGHTLIENAAPIVSFTASPSLAICSGSVVTLSGTGAVSYSWTGSVTDGSPFTPAASSSYTVTGTDASGCTNTAVASVTVNPLPTVTAIATPGSTVCSGQSVTLNGAGASSYTWTGGVSDGVPFTATATTSYTVTGTDGNGCTNTSGITINVNALPTITILSSPGTTICDGSQVTLTGTGATSYSWTGGVINGNPFIPTSTSSYTVTGTDGNGCQNSASVTITVNPVPTVSFTAVPSTSVCAGSSVTLSGTGATSYSWTGSVTDGVAFTPASTASYTVTGTDASGCTNTASVTITVNPLPAVGATATPGTSICSGSPVTLNGSGASSYAWSGGVTDGNSFVPPSTNTYTVTGTDAFGCTGTSTITVTVNPLPTVGATASPSSSVCAGSSVTLNGTGATSYTWSGGVSDGVPFTPPSTASYIVSGTDINGCTNSATITVTVNPLPTVSSSVSPSSTVCAGTMVTLTGSGASSYVWTGGVSDGVPFAASATTTYTVTGTDVNGCTGTATRTITVNPAPVVTATASPSASVCAGSSVTLTGSGATVYTWTGGVTDGVAFTPVATQTYTVTGTDAIGCSGTTTITVTVNPLPSVGSTASPSTTVCSGTMVTLNGTGAATYAWSGGVTDGVPFSATSTATYTVTGTSAAGCTNTSTTTITVNPAPSVTAAASPSSTVCQGTMVTLNGFGASSYAWSGGVTDGVPFAASATTTYTVTGTAASGCTDTASITVNVNPSPNVNAVQSPAGAICAGSSVTLNGTGAISYTWSSGVTNGVAFAPASTATYTVTGTASSGCTNTATITVTVNPLPVVSSTASPGTTVCSGTAVTLNGTGASTYTWTGGVSNGVPFTPSATNTYTVTGTASTGCTNTATTTITVNPSPVVSSTTSPASAVCAGSSVTLSGTGAISYSWSGGVSDGIPFTPASTTTYTVTGTAANGCTGTSTTTITVNPLPAIGSNITPSSLVCAGTMVTMNGTGAVTYSWTGGVQDGVPFSAATSNSYTVTGTDANGCTGSATTSLTVMPVPTVSFAATPATSICIGTQLTLDGTGATTYTWSDSIVVDGNPFTPMVTDTFTVIGTDGNGCVDSAVAIITVNTPPTVTASVSPNDTVCENAMITLNGSGAVTYAWSHGVTDNVAFAAGTTTTYTVIGTDGNGCSDTTTQVVNVIAAPNVSITGNSTFCTGGNTLLSVSGGSSYQWYMNGSAIAGATSSSYSATAAGVYNVWVTNTTGCGDSAVTGVNVIVNTPPTVVANATSTAICRGNSVTLFGSGAVSYAWSGGVNNNVAFAPLNTTTYSVVGTASNGCTDMDTITVVVHTLPIVSSTAIPGYTVCAGTSVTLNGTGAQTYVWTGSVIDGTPFIPLTTSSYTVTGTDGFGCTNTASVTVTVNPMPVVALGPDTAQCGGTITLDAGNAGATYAWSNTATTQVTTVSATATYTVNVTNSFGCSASDTINVTINPQPFVDLGPDTTLCTTSVTLDAMNPGASYLWNDMTTAQANVVTVTGTYFVTATMPGGCTSTDTVNLVLHTPPTVTVTLPLDTVCLNGGSVALGGETPSGGTWSGTGVSGASFDPMVSGTGTFGIMYMFTDTNGCSAGAVDSIFVDPCLGTPEIIAVADFNMYPNPNNGDFNITLNGTSSADVMIYNAAGQLVKTDHMVNGETLAVSLEASGMYMVTLTTAEGQQVTKRVVVNR